MKICPSCSARLGDDVSVCSSCEYRFDAGEGKVDSGAKKTMMGLPALTDYGSMAKGSGSVDEGSPSPTKSPVGSTLFGLPALNFADAFSETSEAGQDATSMISAKDLKQALRKEMRTAPGEVVPEADNSKMTAFGMRAPTLAEMQSGRYEDAVDEPFGGEFGEDDDGHSTRQRLSGASASEVSAALRGWGLDDASSEVDNHQATQVVSAEVLQRGFGGIGRDAQAIGFDADDYSEVKHAAMDREISAEDDFKSGAGSDRFTDSTRSVNPDELFGSKAVLDAGGLPQNILDKVRNETLARQTTSLNVPSISSTPASGLVRARTESGQSLRAMMDTPVMYSEEAVADESSVVDSELPRKTPASGVFKKLKRRLEAEANDQTAVAGDVEKELSGLGLYQVGAEGGSVASDREESFDDLFGESSKPSAFGGSTVSSMADELASIPSISDDFGGDLSLPDSVELEIGKVEPALVAEPEGGLDIEREPEVAAVAASEVAAVVQAVGGKAAEGVVQEKPRVVVQVGVAKGASVEESAGAKGLSKGILIAVVVGLLILGLVAVILFR